MTVLKKLLQIGRKLVIDSAEHIFSYDEVNLQLSKVLWVNNSHKIKKFSCPSPPRSVLVYFCQSDFLNTHKV